MIRRDFLKTTALGIVAIGIPKIVNSRSEDIGDTIEYKGFKLRWSGYIAAYDSNRIFCRWYSFYQDKNNEVRVAYAANPGLEGVARQGQTYNLCAVYPQKFLFEDFIEDSDLAQKIKIETLNRLKKVIDNLSEYEAKG